ncbi:MAG: SGNH/GDSL hydrolase family protein [Anaerolineales bacterium]
MKRIFILTALFLTACLQEVPTSFTPQVVEITIPTVVTETPVVTPTPILPTFTPQPVYNPPAALPAGPISMVAIGDSLTQGDGDDLGLGYPGRLIGMVNGIRPNSSVTNFGQSGWSSDALINGDQGLPGQLERAMAEVKSAKEQGRGSVVFVWIGSNDLWYLYEYGGDINDEAEVQDLQRFSANLDTILSNLRLAGAEVIIALLDDQSKRPVALKGEAFTSITADELERMSVQVQRYNEAITQKADKYGALTVDFYSTDIFTNPATLYNDGNHPNEAGYDIIAQKWFEVLSSILK